MLLKIVHDIDRNSLEEAGWRFDMLLGWRGFFRYWWRVCRASELLEYL